MSAGLACPNCGRELSAQVQSGPAQAVVRCDGCATLLLWSNGRVVRTARAGTPTMMGIPAVQVPAAPAAKPAAPPPKPSAPPPPRAPNVIDDEPPLLELKPEEEAESVGPPPKPLTRAPAPPPPRRETLPLSTVAPATVKSPVVPAQKPAAPPATPKTPTAPAPAPAAAKPASPPPANGGARKDPAPAAAAPSTGAATARKDPTPAPAARKDPTPAPARKDPTPAPGARATAPLGTVAPAKPAAPPARPVMVSAVQSSLPEAPGPKVDPAGWFANEPTGERDEPAPLPPPPATAVALPPSLANPPNLGATPMPTPMPAPAAPANETIATRATTPGTPAPSTTPLPSSPTSTGARPNSPTAPLPSTPTSTGARPNSPTAPLPSTPTSTGARPNSPTAPLPPVATSPTARTISATAPSSAPTVSAPAPAAAPTVQAQAPFVEPAPIATAPASAPTMTAPAPSFGGRTAGTIDARAPEPTELPPQPTLLTPRVPTARPAPANFASTGNQLAADAPTTTHKLPDAARTKKLGLLLGGATGAVALIAILFFALRSSPTPPPEKTSAEKPSAPVVEKPAVPVEKPAVAVEKPAAPVEKPAAPALAVKAPPPAPVEKPAPAENPPAEKIQPTEVAAADPDEKPHHHHHKVLLEYDQRTAPTTPPVPKAGPTPAGEDADAVERARAAYARGNQKLFSGDGNGAIAAYREALQIYPGYVAGYRGLGLAYENTGDKPEAVKALKQYLKTVPGAKDATLIQRRIDHLSHQN